MEALIVSVFMLGTTIFYVLSCVENRVLKFAFDSTSNKVSEADIRFTHEALKRLAPLLPPSNGIVILVGMGGLIYQGIITNWVLSSIIIITLYILMNLYIIFIRRIAYWVNGLKSTSSNGDIKTVRANVKNLVIDHHLGLIANFLVVVLEFYFFVF